MRDPTNRQTRCASQSYATERMHACEDGKQASEEQRAKFLSQPHARTKHQSSMLHYDDVDDCDGKRLRESATLGRHIRKNIYDIRLKGFITSNFRGYHIHICLLLNSDTHKIKKKYMKTKFH